jgi:phage terminase small subunit
VAKHSKKPTGRTSLNARQQAFVREYLIDLNATAAYKRAGYKCGSKTAATAHAARLVANGSVKKAIDAAIAERAERAQIEADDVLRIWWTLANADANELIELRRICCRFCHGENFDYQRTPAEMRKAKAGHEMLVQKARSTGLPAPPAFEPLGGDGYNGSKRPNQCCPECHGDGVPIAFPKDTRELSEAARLLYDGVKVTNDGIEIKLRDRTAALFNVARHLGMFDPKAKPSATDHDIIPIRMIEIFRAYEPTHAAS